MVEPADQFHLALEPRDDPLVRDDLRGDDLDRDDAVHHLVMGLVHPAHRPRTEPVEDDVAADDQAVGLVAEKPPRLVFGQDLSLTSRSASAVDSLG